MYNMLLRNILTGEKHWYTDCYLNGKVKKNKVIFWKGPEDATITKYKIIAWKWQGYDRKLSKKDQEIQDFANKALLTLDLPLEWRDELTKHI